MHRLHVNRKEDAVLYVPKKGSVVSLPLAGLYEVGDAVTTNVTVKASGEQAQVLVITGVVVSIPWFWMFGSYGVEVITVNAVVPK